MSSCGGMTKVREIPPHVITTPVVSNLFKDSNTTTTSQALRYYLKIPNQTKLKETATSVEIYQNQQICYSERDGF